MVLRNIVIIDQEKCNGCGQCVDDCAEGAIELVDGKAVLTSDIYCDGLGACIGHCPQDAITVEKRQARPFDEKAVEDHLKTKKNVQAAAEAFACPGMAAHSFGSDRTVNSESTGSALGQWPVQLALVPVSAPYLAGADLLLAADCVPFAMGDFHGRFLCGRRLAVGCPKLDDPDAYVEKLAAIIKDNNLNSLTVIHMEVPCCGGLTQIARSAIKKSGKNLSFTDVTVALDGRVLSSRTVSL